MSELGDLRRALWGSEGERSAAAWRELGRQACGDGWARRLLLDVLHGRTALSAGSCTPSIEQWARREPDFLLSLVRHADSAVASVVGAGMGRAGGGGEEELLRLSRENTLANRLAAVAGLAELAAGGSPRATEQLAVMLEDPQGEARWAAAAALGKARRPVCLSVATAALRRAAGSGDDPVLSGAAFGAAALYPAKPRVGTSLLRTIADRSAVGAAAVAAALADLPWRAAQPFAARLANDPDPARRRAIASAAARWGEESCDLLSRAVTDADPTVRAAAAESLGAWAWEGASELLQARAHDRVAVVRAAAVASLARLGDTEPAHRACRERDPVVRAAACAHLREPGDAELLLTLTKDSDAAVARAALAALGAHASELAGPIWERLQQACAVATLSSGAAAGLAAALDRHPSAAAEAIWSWPVQAAGAEIIAGLARVARHPDVSELARTASHALVSDDLAEALEDHSLALQEAGHRRAAKACGWLARGAGVKTEEDLAALAKGAPGREDGLAQLGSVTRALAARRAGRSRSGLEAALGQDPKTLAHALAHRVARRWQQLLAAGEEQAARADLRVIVPPAEIIAGAAPTVVLTLENTQRATAQGIEIATQGGRLVSVSEVPPGVRRQVPVAIGAAIAGRVEVRGEVRYRDPAGSHCLPFSGVLEAAAPRRLGRVPNPYVVGKPLAPGSAMFFGRGRELAFLERALSSGESGAVAVLVGPRRSGKTSLLRQLEARLQGPYRPVFIDVQGLLVTGVSAFFAELAKRIASSEAGYSSREPVLRSDDTATYADMVRDAAGPGGGVVLLLDEFDDLGEKVRAGRLSPEVFGQFRNLLQHSPNLGVVLCGTHRLEELAGDYWSFLLNLATYCPVGPLDERSAVQVISDPLSRLGIVYEDAATWAAGELSGQQPYLLQMLGYRVVERCVSSGEGVVRYHDVMQVADEVVEQGEIHLRYLWELAGSKGRAALRELVRSGGGTPIPAGELARTLHALRELDLVTEESGHYRLRVGLLGRWLAQGGGEEL